MEKNYYTIGNTPAVVYGGVSDKAFLFVHGLCGSKADAERFAQTAVPLGYQVLAMDLPEHGGRTDGARLLPWEVLPELKKVMSHARDKWQDISVYAISIGAWFSLLSFAGEDIKRCLLVSPLLDMENMISNMMNKAGVTEQQLKAAGEIPCADGQTLSWKYLCWARENPVNALCENTSILYATGDELIPRSVIDSFTERTHSRLTLLEGGHHWIHTEEEVAFLSQWERQFLA